MNKSQIISKKKYKINAQVHSVRVLVRINNCFMKEGKKKDGALDF